MPVRRPHTDGLQQRGLGNLEIFGFCATKKSTDCAVFAAALSKPAFNCYIFRSVVRLFATKAEQYKTNKNSNAQLSGPGMRMSFIVVKWRPTQAALLRVYRRRLAAVAAACGGASSLRRRRCV